MTTLILFLSTVPFVTAFLLGAFDQKPKYNGK